MILLTSEVLIDVCGLIRLVKVYVLMSALGGKRNDTVEFLPLNGAYERLLDNVKTMLILLDLDPLSIVFLP